MPLTTRPKRPGTEWQRLRACAAMLIGSLRVFQRAGWGANPAVVGPAREPGGGNMVERLLQIRVVGLWELASLVSGGAWLSTNTTPLWAALGDRRFMAPMPPKPAQEVV